MASSGSVLSKLELDCYQHANRFVLASIRDILPSKVQHNINPHAPGEIVTLFRQNPALKSFQQVIRVSVDRLATRLAEKMFRKSSRKEADAANPRFFCGQGIIGRIPHHDTPGWRNPAEFPDSCLKDVRMRLRFLGVIGRSCGFEQIINSTDLLVGLQILLAGGRS